MADKKEVTDLKIKILAVDDSKLILKFIEKTLGDQYELKTAGSVLEAYKIMESYIPDLILLDLQMPDIDGYDFLRYIKAVERYKDTPIVLLTALNNHETEEKAFSLGAADYILKPITESILKIRVGLHIDQIRYNRHIKEQIILAENQLDSLTQTVSDINARANAMLDAAPLLITFWDKDLNIVECNQACPAFWGLTNKKKFMEDFFKFSPEFQPNKEKSKDALARLMKQAFDEGSVVSEWTHQDLSGDEIACETIFTRIDYNNEQMVICYTRDLRNEKEAQTEKERAEIAIETAKAKSSFLATMSHEIRTPMNAILGIAEAQLYNQDLAPDTIDALDKIYASANSLIRIINDILDFSKIESGKLEILVEEYDLPSIVCDTAQLNLLYLDTKEIEFVLDVDAKCRSNFLGDQLRIKQVLNNLLSNSFKYTDKGKVSFTVHEECEDSTTADNLSTLVFHIEDTGVGMSPESVETLFDEYSRFGGVAQSYTQGTGLGMSITRRLTEMMDGTISVESELNKGTTFTVRIPQQPVGDSIIGEEVSKNLRELKLNTTAQMRTAQVTREPMPYGNVLVVDDIETNLYVARGLLLPYGLKTETADSGFAALEKIAAGKTYDIIFMDHMMPKMDGIETTKKMRDSGYNLPIVALTANAVAGQREIFFANGFDEFISKPIDTRQLNLVLNKFVRDKHKDNNTEAYQKFLKLPPELASPQGVFDKSMLTEVFIRDAKKSIPQLEEISSYSYRRENDINSYIIIIHGLKSALGNIGEIKLSKVAAGLEAAGRDNDLDFIMKKTPEFLDELKMVVGNLTPKISNEEEFFDMSFLCKHLDIVAKACDNFDAKTARNAIKELREKNWKPAIAEQLMEISEYLLASDFENIPKLVEEIKLMG